MSGESPIEHHASSAARWTATSGGFIAIALWASLGLLTTLTGAIPPFQLAAMTFLVGGLAGATRWLLRRDAFEALRQAPRVWLIGVGGLFGYHALYFTALRLAPPAEAGLVNYLWPLLLVLGSGLLPGHRLHPMHLLGALVGFAGVAVLIAGRSAVAFDAGHLPGYLCAFAAAFVWAAYSLISRRFGTVPTDAVTGFCLATSMLAWIAHRLFETTVWPSGAVQWSALFVLGIGPLGAAFHLWDRGMKHGDIRTVGFASYATPVLSTLLLVVAGKSPAHWTLALACGLIAGGAALAALAPRAATTS